MGSCHVNIDLDIWKYITYRQEADAERKGYKLYEKEEFRHFSGLPDDWFYTLNEHGEGFTVQFPIKAKPKDVLSSSGFVSRSGRLEKAQRIPLEKVTIDFVKRACNVDNILIQGK